MPRLEKIALPLLSISLLFSENTGKAFLYTCCLSGFFKQKYHLLLFGITSVIFDIYHSIFVGCSFLSLVIIVMIEKKFDSIFSNLSVLVRSYYLFMMICGTELVSCLFIVLLDGRLNLDSHFLIVMESMLFYYILESFKKHAQRS